MRDPTNISVDESRSNEGTREDKRSQFQQDVHHIYLMANGVTESTHGKASFDQWYRDVPGINISVEYPMRLTATGERGLCLLVGGFLPYR